MVRVRYGVWAAARVDKSATIADKQLAVKMTSFEARDRGRVKVRAVVRTRVRADIS